MQHQTDLEENVPPGSSGSENIAGAGPRLIESWMPVNETSSESIRERSAASALPPVNWLHVWWARRPLTAARAATLLSVLPENATRNQAMMVLGTKPGIHKVAQRLSEAKQEGKKDPDGYGKIRRAFTHNPTEQEIAWLNTQLPSPDPTILDVTAGGGSIPFEAGRLGFRTIANELNPVACHILRATCEWPQEYGYPLLDDYQEVSTRFQTRVSELIDGIYPEEPGPTCADGNCPHPQRYRCTNDCDDSPECSHRKVGNPEHIKVLPQRHVWGYLWARTARCPGCNVEIPLSPNWRLDSKSTGMSMEPNATSIELRIVHDQNSCSDCRTEKKDCHLATLHPDRKVSEGTENKAIATCPACGSTTPKGYLAQEAQAGRMGHRLYCVIYRDSWRDKTKKGKESKNETTCQVFAEPEERHFANIAHTARELAQREPEWNADDVLPSEALPDGNKTKDATYYGMPMWRDMFSSRQLLAHGYCVQAFRECVDTDQDSGRLDDRRKAAWSYVAIALDKMINRNSLLTRWDGGANKVAGTFDSHDFGMKWSYSEMAVACRGIGLEWSINDIVDCLSQLLSMAGHTNDGKQLLTAKSETGKTASPTKVINGDARDLPIDDASVDCVVFDPPYEENVCYAELSDFFYVWLKRTAGYVFPEDFTHYLTEKDQEAISSPARFKNRATKGKSAKKLALETGPKRPGWGEGFRQ